MTTNKKQLIKEYAILDDEIFKLKEILKQKTNEKQKIFDEIVSTMDNQIGVIANFRNMDYVLGYKVGPKYDKIDKKMKATEFLCIKIKLGNNNE